MGILRIILAISVVIAHSNPIFGITMVGGLIAVKAFYIISGFYMSLILNEKYTGKNNSFYLFITNRFLRLFPIYWCILLLSFLFILLVHNDTTDLYINDFPKMNFGGIFFVLFTNIALFFQDAVMFLGVDKNSGQLFFTANYHLTDPHLYKFLLVPQAWTIGVELLFYLLAPFLVRLKLIFIFILVMLSLLLRFYLNKIGLDNDPWSYRFFPSELFFFLLGNISYRIYKKYNSIKIKKAYLNLILLLVISFTILYGSISFSQKEIFYYCMIFLAIPFIFYHTKYFKIDLAIGELSYPVYLCHILLLNCLIVLKIPKIDAGYGLILIVSSILFSVLLNEVIAKKIEKKRQARVL